MATVADGLKYAESFKGVTESPPNSNRTRIGEMYGWNGVAWCQEYVWVVLNKFGVAGDKTASTIAAANDWAERNQLVADFNDLQPGDQIFYNFSSSEPNIRSTIEHTGIVLKKPQGGVVTAIEGNTSSTDAGSQSNGGGVFVRQRAASLFVCGGRPKWSDAAKAKGGAARPKSEIGMGDKGHDVRLWQKALNEWSQEKGKGKINLEVDGEFGESTRRATKIYQEAHGFNPDGTVDLKLIRKIEKREAEEAKEAKAGGKGAEAKPGKEPKDDKTGSDGKGEKGKKGAGTGGGEHH
jgi:hypothetical protein